MKNLKMLLGLFALLLTVVLVLPSCDNSKVGTPTETVVTVSTVTDTIVTIPLDTAYLPMHPPGEQEVQKGSAPMPAPMPNESQGVGDFMLTNWEVLLFLLLALVKGIVNLTPSTKDNKVFTLLDNFINWLVPNLKKGGGRH